MKAFNSSHGTLAEKAPSFSDPTRGVASRSKNLSRQVHTWAPGSPSVSSRHESPLKTRVPILLPELWAEIFSYFQTEAPDLPMNDSIYGPLLLAQICRDWRNIVLSTPTLWSRIRIAIDKPRRSQSGAMMILNVWLERSQHAPLHVHMLEDPGLSWAKPIDSIEKLDILSLRVLAESHRWERFHLETQSPPGALNAFDSIRNNIPLLHEWKISYHRDHRFPVPLQDIDLVNNAPRLNSFITNHPLLFFKVKMPFHQLRRIDLLRVPFTSERLPMDDCLKVLSNCMNLTYLGINCDASRVTSSPVVHTMLEELFLASSAENTESDANSISILLDHLTTPGLKHFGYIGRVWDDAVFLRFISRTPKLETLNTWCEAISGEEIFRYIHLIPTMKKLYFTSSQGAVQFLVAKLLEKPDAWPSLLGDLKYVAGETIHTILPGDYSYRLAAGARIKVMKLTR